ncbi:unnamed protein product [Clonostachys rhizophaga]|uniref:P-loop containing nucleoside triphosphate hydrolase protein n=1 Tax=Clonostachys rhizophaga TaxID=160324 RepID=A0A9N9YN85_9HYPO|nr:unnamed protein product [Clonostachys rhizophaga]
MIYYGMIASGNQVIRNGAQRDNIAQQLDAICFEMEAAGLMDILPACLSGGFMIILILIRTRNSRDMLQLPRLLPSKLSLAYKACLYRTMSFATLTLNRTTEGMCLYGLGGIGKMQLAIDFACRYKATFSVIFWLDGRSEDQLKQSFARCLGRIPELWTASRNDLNLNSKEGLDVAVMKVIEWLARLNQQHGGATEIYNIQQYFPGDHGSVLITTRLLRLQQLGSSKYLTYVDPDQSRATLQTWYGKELHWRPDYDTLLELLQGLLLALAQAVLYLCEIGMGVATYIQIYNQ